MDQKQTNKRLDLEIQVEIKEQYRDRQVMMIIKNKINLENQVRTRDFGNNAE